MFILKPVFRMLLLSCFFIAGVVYGMPQSTESKTTISSWSEIAERYETFRDESYPLVVPGGSWLSYGSWESVQAELTSFVKGSWFWYFTASDYRINPKSRLGKKVKDKISLLIYEDIYSGEIIIAKERKDGRYIEVYSQKTLPILEALALGMTTFEETARRRIVWQASVVPYNYAEPVAMRSASIPTPPGGGTNSGGNGTFNSMTQEEWDAIHSATNMWIAIERQGVIGANSIVLTVHPPTNTTHNIDIFANEHIANAFAWNLVASDIIQNSQNLATWTDSYPTAKTMFYRAADAEDDPDIDGLSSGKERFLYFTNPYVSDTDYDGIIDGWEILYGLDPFQDDSLIDLDNDGFVNIYEYKHGTVPTESNSVPDSTIICTTANYTWVQILLSGITNDYEILELPSGEYDGSYAMSGWYINNHPVMIFCRQPGNAVITCHDEYKSCIDLGPQASPQVVISGIIMEHAGKSAIELTGATPLIMKCIFRKNTYGIYSFCPWLTITNDSSVKIRDSFFLENWRGASFCCGRVSVENCIFQSNGYWSSSIVTVPPLTGAGLTISQTSNSVITNCVFDGNTGTTCCRA